MFPPVLKALSEGLLVAVIHKYFLASMDNLGYCPLLLFHHFKGSSSLSIFLESRYAPSSMSTTCSTSGAAASFPFATLKKLPKVFLFFPPGGGVALEEAVVGVRLRLSLKRENRI